jgi:hypothetical protein
MNNSTPMTDITNVSNDTRQQGGESTTGESRRATRANDRNTSNNGNKGKQTGNKRSTFQGNTEGMNGHVFQCHNETQDRQQFEKTLDALFEYINKELDHAGDVVSLCEDFTVIDLKKIEPKDFDENEKSMLKKKKWEQDVETYLERVNSLDSNLRHIFAVVYGQCSYSMQTKLMTNTDFVTMKKKSDCGWLLKEIKGITNQFETSRLIHISLDIALQHYYTYYQGPHQSLNNFYKTFKSQIEVLEHYGADVGTDRAFVQAARKTMTPPLPTDDNYEVLIDAYEDLVITTAKKKAIAVSFLRRVSRNKFGQLWVDLQNDFARGHDNFPNSLVEAYDLLLHYVPPHRADTKQSKFGSKSHSGLQFVQNTTRGKQVAGVDGIIHEGVECYYCHEEGHYKPQCPKLH